MNNIDQLDAARVKPALAKKPRKPAAKKTHAIKHSLTLGGRSWAYCGKDTNKEGFLIAPEGTEPTCGICKAHPEYEHLEAVKNFKARQIARMVIEEEQARREYRMKPDPRLNLKEDTL